MAGRFAAPFLSTLWFQCSTSDLALGNCWDRQDVLAEIIPLLFRGFVHKALDVGWLNLGETFVFLGPGFKLHFKSRGSAAAGSWKEPPLLPELLRKAQGEPRTLISYEGDSAPPSPPVF